MRGKTPVDRTFLMRGRRVNVIAAISSNGVLDAAMYEHNVNGDCFMDFLRKSLLPILQPFNGVNPHSIVIMDNASIHHVDAVADLVRGVGAILKFLPPYSPDFNPIEEVFSKVKYYLRANDLSRAPAREQILHAFGSVTALDCISYMNHSGYVID